VGVELKSSWPSLPPLLMVNRKFVANCGRYERRLEEQMGISPKMGASPPQIRVLSPYVYGRRQNLSF
jgi:hypothetical protein